MNTIADSTTAAVQEIATIPKYPFLFWAYVVIFAVIFIYLITIHLRQRRIDRPNYRLARFILIQLCHHHCLTVAQFHLVPWRKWRHRLQKRTVRHRVEPFHITGILQAF